MWICTSSPKDPGACEGSQGAQPTLTGGSRFYCLLPMRSFCERWCGKDTHSLQIHSRIEEPTKDAPSGRGSKYQVRITMGERVGVGRRSGGSQIVLVTWCLPMFKLIFSHNSCRFTPVGCTIVDGPYGRV